MAAIASSSLGYWHDEAGWDAKLILSAISCAEVSDAARGGARGRPPPTPEENSLKRVLRSRFKMSLWGGVKCVLQGGGLLRHQSWVHRSVQVLFHCSLCSLRHDANHKRQT